MSEDPKDRDEAQKEEEEARAFVLKRRARFVAAAMAGVGVMASCGGEAKDTANPNPCLSGVVTGGMSGTGGTPQVCLSPGVAAYGGTAAAGGVYGSGGIPQPCLTTPAATGGYVGSGGYPQPCLEPPASGGYYFGSGGIPQVCLGAPGGSIGSGGTPPDIDGGADAAPGDGSAGAGGTGGVSGAGGTGGIPQPCLSVPAQNDVRKK